MTRRVFIKAGGLALVSLGIAPSFLARTVEAAGRQRKLLIAIFQRGAVDGLNMIVPYGEADYYRSRPSIAIARPGASGGAVDLDGFFGLHPRLSPLHPFWLDGSLAVVHACGSHDGTRSHFDAQDYMESATPGVKSTRDGWINRYLQVEPDAVANPLRAVSLTRTMPRALQGRAPTLAVGRVDEFGVRGGMGAGASFEAAYAEAADRVLGGTASEAFDAMRTLRGATRGRYQAAHGADYPRSPFGQALQEIARLAKADVGLEVAFAESGQWDHHVNQGGATGQMANRLDDFARGIAALARDLGERLADTVILSMSEFGRAVSENGNRGTDHGHGNAMLLIGGSVKGRRVYGPWPGLRPEARFEGRDLAVTTDFRDVFAEVLVRHLGVDRDTGAQVFPSYGIGPRNFLGLL
ncbi:MAG: DUF1501 domain-containing protein [Vicinamibacterales bacterium]